MQDKTNLLSKMKYYYGNQYYDTLEKAYTFAGTAHKGQMRASGEEYVSHPYEVAEILVDMGLDAATIAASMLHDVVEDTGVTREELKREFGEEVCLLVDGVTKLERINFQSKEEEQAENLRKMFVAMASDIRVILIKLADRLHNMRSLAYLEKDRQLAMAKETLEIYAPIAGRLGISNIKCELEDLCLKFLEPEAYKLLAEIISAKRDERREMVDVVTRELKGMLSEIAVEGDISGRPKHFYSIYKKMKLQNRTIEQIYDLIAVRIIVDSVKDCYNVLGTIHTRWKPIPGRIKDYIAMPKPNMYQSLHTTVVTNFGQTFEIQIRTYEMHRIAEYGIAAHWKYKEKNEGSLDKKLSWVREVLEWQSDFKDSREFYNGLKVDLVSNEVLVFTPKGDVISLPRGSTPLDFAYHIHSAIGNKCVGAKINSRMVPLTTVLDVGDVVEIITSQNAKGPSLDWIKIVKTSGAKAKIRQFFKREMKDENIKFGKEMLESAAKRKGYDFYDMYSEKALLPIMEKYSFSTPEEVFAAVGYGALTTSQVITRLIDQYDKARPQEQKLPVLPTNQRKNKNTVGTGIVIKGFDDLLVRFAGCCNPVPGDSIIGFISRGRGVSIHRSDCPNLTNIEKERLVESSWAVNKEQRYSAGLQILANDSSGLIANIGNIVSEMKLNITGINARLDKNKKAIINVTVSLNNLTELDMLAKKIKGNPMVLDVFRTTI